MSNDNTEIPAERAGAQKLIKVSTVVELLGVLFIIAAAFAWDWRMGLAIVGVALVLAGFVLDHDDPAGFE
jgi:hypothetical protein